MFANDYQVAFLLMHVEGSPCHRVKCVLVAVGLIPKFKLQLTTQNVQINSKTRLLRNAKCVNIILVLM